jgi:hypothetical protein
MSLEDIGENFEGPSWSNRIFFYFCLFSFILIIFLLVFIGFAAINPNFAIPSDPHHNSTQLRDMGFFDNERYLISALVQSLAATIALVITLSLVAVQLAAQSYSTRVIEVYKNNPDMWILLSIYIAVIFYGLGLLKVIDIGIAGISMEIAIFWAYFLGFFAFICLVPYIWNTLDLLTPSNIIKLTKEKIRVNFSEKELDTEKVFLSLIDIINSASEKNDYETIRIGLETIKDLIFVLFDKLGSETNDNSRFILESLETFGIDAANRNKEIFVRYVIAILYEIGIKTVEKELDYSCSKVVTALEHVGKKVTENQLEVTLEVVNKLTEIAKQAIEKKSLDSCVQKALKALENVAIIAAKKELGNAVLYTVNGLGDIGKLALRNERRNLSQEVAIALGSVGTKAAEKSCDTAANNAVNALKDVGIKAINKDFEITALSTIKGLGNVGTQALKSNFPTIALEAINALNENTKILPEKKYGNVAGAIVHSLKNIGLQTVEERKYDIVLKTTLEALKNVGIKAAKENLEYNPSEIRSRVEKGDGVKLETIETVVGNKNVEDEVKEAFGSLAKKLKDFLPNDSKELINTILLYTMQIETCDKKS